MKKTYHGSCHCGRVRFEADLDLEAGTGRCNCSYCSKQGHHRFCHACGIAAFGEGDVKEIGGAFVSVNVACLDDITPEELAKLPVQYMDGRHDNWFQPPKVTSYL